MSTSTPTTPETHPLLSDESWGLLASIAAHPGGLNINRYNKKHWEPLFLNSLAECNDRFQQMAELTPAGEAYLENQDPNTDLDQLMALFVRPLEEPPEAIDIPQASLDHLSAIQTRGFSTGSGPDNDAEIFPLLVHRLVTCEHRVQQCTRLTPEGEAFLAANTTSETQPLTVVHPDPPDILVKAYAKLTMGPARDILERCVSRQTRIRTSQLDANKLFRYLVANEGWGLDDAMAVFRAASKQAKD